MTGVPEVTAALRFLMDLGQELLTQDGAGSPEGPSHCTGDPIYQVKELRRTYGVDPCSADPDGVAYLIDGEYYDDADFWDELPEDAEEVPYIERWELVPGAVSLTRRGIEGYLRKNRHNLNSPRIFVGSMERVPEMIELRRHLMALARAAQGEQ